ncbi:DoxX family protein [Microlunatus speluncae]|uniref:DoxX family protein n=1 Tax=Microlunatus speluncae TaxID=2594267 RepID=UPI00126614E6|nr:DoxX family protein [Microlunatus speluncae]
MIEPWWPLAVLALIQLGDGLLCLKPVQFIRKCFEDVGFPKRWWWVAAPIKFAAAAGLVIGIWWRPLAILTTAALVLYFLLAGTAHLRARDFGRNFFLTCLGMLALCTAALIFTLLA